MQSGVFLFLPGCLSSRRGGIGRRARFRSVFRKDCGFNSHRRYQKKLILHIGKSIKNISGYGITAVHQPSKLVIGVRPPLPAPIYGGIAERSKAADCKSALSEFDGSNPSPTTIFNLKTATFVAVFYHIRFQFPKLELY